MFERMPYPAQNLTACGLLQVMMSRKTTNPVAQKLLYDKL